jgi:hypothetical protein
MNPPNSSSVVPVSPPVRVDFHETCYRDSDTLRAQPGIPIKVGSVGAERPHGVRSPIAEAIWETLREAKYMIKVTRIGHATFETSDVNRQIEYCTEIVGLALVGSESGRAFLATALGDLVVQLEKGAEAHGVQLGELALARRQETYRPDPIRRVYIPKANGKLRPRASQPCAIGSARQQRCWCSNRSSKPTFHQNSTPTLLGATRNRQ